MIHDRQLSVYQNVIGVYVISLCIVVSFRFHVLIYCILLLLVWKSLSFPTSVIVIVLVEVHILVSNLATCNTLVLGFILISPPITCSHSVSQSSVGRNTIAILMIAPTPTRLSVVLKKKKSKKVFFPLAE